MRHMPRINMEQTCFECHLLLSSRLGFPNGHLYAIQTICIPHFFSHSISQNERDFRVKGEEICAYKDNLRTKVVLCLLFVCMDL